VRLHPSQEQCDERDGERVAEEHASPSCDEPGAHRPVAARAV